MKKTINKKNNNYKGVLFLGLAFLFAFISGLPNASAIMTLDNIYFDPAVVAAGDEVDVVIQFKATFSDLDTDYFDDPDYSFRVLLKPDDSLTEKYVTIQDAYGDYTNGVIFGDEIYNRKFRVKIEQDAPAGTYEFKLSGTWYYQGEALPSEQYVRFTIPVKKEAIVLGVGSFTTSPAEVRPGDDYVRIDASIHNSGVKDAKSAEITLRTPTGIEPSYTNNNRVWVGYVPAGQEKQISFFLNVADDIKPDSYTAVFDIAYEDVDGNTYDETVMLPFLIKARPNLEIVKVEGSGLAGKTGDLYVTVKNLGTEDAESTDVRLIKQSAQPFSTDVRSDYLGLIAPGEESVAVFHLDVSRDAEIKKHDLKLIIRAKGDSDSGDDNIYLFNRNAPFEVTGKKSNAFLYVGLAILAIIVLAFVFGGSSKKKSSHKRVRA